MIGSTLQPSDYVNERVCTNPEHNHINHVRTVDLSTALFPETTWCFYGQSHKDTASNSAVICLALDIVGDKVTDIYSNPEYPQFIMAYDWQYLDYDPHQGTVFKNGLTDFLECTAIEEFSSWHV